MPRMVEPPPKRPYWSFIGQIVPGLDDAARLEPDLELGDNFLDDLHFSQFRIILYFHMFDARLWVK